VKGQPDPDPESFDRESMPGFTPDECHLVCDDCWCCFVAALRLAAEIERSR
jgi:hypothetical protein